jgi:hypothetical protein
MILVRTVTKETIVREYWPDVSIELDLLRSNRDTFALRDTKGCVNERKDNMKYRWFDHSWQDWFSGSAMG